MWRVCCALCKRIRCLHSWVIKWLVCHKFNEKTEIDILDLLKVISTRINDPLRP